MAQQIQLSAGKVATVDDADFDWLSRWKWTYMSSGYAYRQEPIGRWWDRKLRTVFMHRFIMDAPAGMYVDHINHDTLDNRRCNLRIVTPTQSLRNTRALRGGTSLFKGVSLQSGRWCAEIWVDGNHMRLGRFLTQKDAARAYNAAAVAHFGEHACLNDLEALSDTLDIPIIPKLVRK